MNKEAQDEVCNVLADLLEELNDPQKKNGEVLYYLLNLIQPSSINFTFRKRNRKHFAML